MAKKKAAAAKRPREPERRRPHQKKAKAGGEALEVFGDVAAGLRVARARAGLAQREVAERAGVTQAMLSRYESGSEFPRLPTLDAILSALDLRLAEFATLASAVQESDPEVERLREQHRGAVRAALFALVDQGDVDDRMIQDLRDTLRAKK